MSIYYANKYKYLWLYSPIAMIASMHLDPKMHLRLWIVQFSPSAPSTPAPSNTGSRPAAPHTSPAARTRSGPRAPDSSASLRRESPCDMHQTDGCDGKHCSDPVWARCGLRGNTHRYIWKQCITHLIKSHNLTFEQFLSGSRSWIWHTPACLRCRDTIKRFELCVWPIVYTTPAFRDRKLRL